MKTTIVLAVLLAATVVGAQEPTTYLAFKTTPTPISNYERGYAAGLASCRCAGSWSSGGMVVAPAAPAQPQGAPAAYYSDMRRQQQIDDIRMQQQRDNTAEQSTLVHLAGGKVLE